MRLARFSRRATVAPRASHEQETGGNPSFDTVPAVGGIFAFCAEPPQLLPHIALLVQPPVYRPSESSLKCGPVAVGRKGFRSYPVARVNKCGAPGRHPFAYTPHTHARLAHRASRRAAAATLPIQAASVPLQ